MTYHTCPQEMTQSEPLVKDELDDRMLNLDESLHQCCSNRIFGRASRVFVARIYCPQTWQNRIKSVLQDEKPDNANVQARLPGVITSPRFPLSYASDLKQELGVYQSAHPNSCRVLCVVILKQYLPITDLVGDRFWLAFWECFMCHYRSWLHGVEHGDICPTHLMYEKLLDGTITGKLKDFGLAHVEGLPGRSMGCDQAGTMPFMALDLLTKKAWEGKGARLYRHDCESFAWVLLWICARYENGKEIPNPPFEKWRTDTYEQCHLVKYAEKLVRVRGTSSYESYWACSVVLMLSHRDRAIATSRAAVMASLLSPSDSDQPKPLPELTVEFMKEWITVFDHPFFQDTGNPLKGLKLEL